MVRQHFALTASGRRTPTLLE